MVPPATFYMDTSCEEVAHHQGHVGQEGEGQEAVQQDKVEGAEQLRSMLCDFIFIPLSCDFVYISVVIAANGEMKKGTGVTT